MRPRRVLWIAVALLALVGLAPIAAAWYVSGLFTRPPWYEHRTPAQGLPSRAGDAWIEADWQGVHRDPRADLGLDYRDVEFETVGGAVLRGWLVPGASDARTGVVTVHGGGADRREYLRMLPVFHDAGYPVLLFDLREHGISDGNARGLSFGVREHRDVIFAVRHLRKQTGVEHVAVVGASMGAATAILAAALSDEIDAVIAEYPAGSLETWVPYMIRSQAGAAVASDFAAQGETAPELLLGAGQPEWWIELVTFFLLWRIDGDPDLDPLDVVDRIAPRPLLLMHGERDRMAPVADSRELFSRAGEPKELWIMPDGDHTSFYNAHPEAWRARVLGFLRKHLPR